MRNNQNEEHIPESIRSGHKDNFGYTLYSIDKYSNEYRCEYKVVSSSDGKEFLGFTEEDALSQFYNYVEGQMALITSRFSPLNKNEIEILKNKIQKNIRFLYKTLIKQHYIKDGDCGLTTKEIFNEHNLIAQSLLEFNNNTEVIYEKIDRYIGGYYYILLDKKYETSNGEQHRIERELNDRK
ncbi:unknown [Acidiphilium sp. CAG:727]|nr:unknown [Acidiphilium sp. CAG:727]